jgi:hypothetical protein
VIQRAGVAAVVLLLLAASASAAEQDVRGTWNCCTQSTNPLVGNQVQVITSENLSTGQWSGWGYGGPYTWPINGTVTGNNMTFAIPFYYQLPSYSAQGTGTISGSSWQSNFTDSNGSSGTFVLTKAAAAQPPIAGKAVDAKTVSGTVLVKLPAAKSFTDLGKVAIQLPIGTVVDVRHGRIRLTAALGTGSKKTGVADFYDGEFRIGQPATARAVTNLTLVGGNFGVCGKASSTAASAAQKTKIRHLWGAGKGLFRTTGRYASAAIRGTQWDVADYCDGTLTKVTAGSVTVRDFVRKRNIVVKAGHSYFARAKR